MIRKLISVLILLSSVSCIESEEQTQKNLELSRQFFKTGRPANHVQLVEVNDKVKEGQDMALININDSKIGSKHVNYINIILPHSQDKRTARHITDASILAYFEFKNRENTEIRFFDISSEKEFFGLKSFIMNLPENVTSDFVIYEYDQRIASLFMETPHRIYLVNDLFPYNEIDESIEIRSINADYMSQIETVFSYAINNQYESYYLLLPNISESKNYIKFVNKILAENNLALNMLEYYDPGDEKSLVISNKNLWRKMSSDENKALFVFVNYQNKWGLINQEWSKAVNPEKDNLYAVIDNFSQNFEDLAKVENKSLIFTDLKISTDSIFKNKFSKIFYYETSEVANLTYDVVSLILSYKNSENIEQFLNKEQGFSGVTGIFNFNNNRVVAKRNLSLTRYQKENLTK